MNVRRRIPALVAMLVAALALVAVPSAAQAKHGNGLKSFHGKVRSVSADDDSFTLGRGGGRSLRFTVNENTVFEHLTGLGDLRRGMRIEVKVKRGDGSRLARKVERESVDDDGTDDNGGDRGGSDDPPGDDNGGDRAGSDDGPGDDHGGRHGGEDD